MRTSLVVSGLRSSVFGLVLSLAGGSVAAQQTTAAAPAPTTSYMLRAGDVLKVTVWGHADFSGQFVVDETNHIQFPVIGDIDAHNVSVAELRDRLRAGLDQLFKQPFVTVEPLFRMAVLGQVRSPGLYTVNPTLSVLDVVAMAGGPTPSGSLNKIQLMRGGEALQLSFSKGSSLQDMGVRSGDQIMVGRKGFSREDLGLILTVAQVALSVAILVTTLKNN